MASEKSENYPGKTEKKNGNKLTILKIDIDKSLQTAAACETRCAYTYPV